MANTFKFGNGNWAVKDGYALAYNDENNNFKPLPFDFTRASSATRVNKQGLIETVPSGKPRIDFTDNTSGHLLLEPSRKNDITDYTGASFSAFNGATITANDSNSPDGSSNATLMTTTGGANELIQQASITILSGQSYTVSGYFKLKSGTLSDPDNAFKGLDGLNGGGVTGSTFNSTLTSEWQRLSFTVTSSTTSGRVQIKCEDAAEILVWGLQVEQGSYATSYIPTEGSSVTRVAEVANGAGNSTVFNDSEGVLYVEISALANDGTSRRISISAGNSNNDNLVSLIYGTSNKISPSIYSNGNFQMGGDYTLSDQTQKIKVALKYSLNDAALWVNGVEVLTDDIVTTPIGLNQIKFEYGNGSNDFYGKVKNLKVYNTALTDTELQNLTS
jgi:hypothetical protein